MCDWQFWYLDCVNCGSDGAVAQPSDHPALSVSALPRLALLTQHRQPHDLDCQTKRGRLSVSPDRSSHVERGEGRFWLNKRKQIDTDWHGVKGSRAGSGPVARQPRQLLSQVRLSVKKPVSEPCLRRCCRIYSLLHLCEARAAAPCVCSVLGWSRDLPGNKTWPTHVPRLQSHTAARRQNRAARNNVRVNPEECVSSLQSVRAM